jgi:hypothetical protein
LDELDPFDSALSLLEIASSLHSSQRESLESVDFFVEDELPCSSALLKVVGSLFSADADDESSHAAKNATMQSATKIFFIKIFRPRGLIYPVEI